MQTVRKGGLAPAARCAKPDRRSRPALLRRGGYAPSDTPGGSRPPLSHAVRPRARTMQLVRKGGLAPAARCARRDLRSRPAHLRRGGYAPSDTPGGSRPPLSHAVRPRARTMQLVRKGGLEPPQVLPHRLLRPARLPVPPLSREREDSGRRHRGQPARAGALLASLPTTMIAMEKELRAFGRARPASGSSGGTGRSEGLREPGRSGRARGRGLRPDRGRRDPARHSGAGAARDRVRGSAGRPGVPRDRKGARLAGAQRCASSTAREGDSGRRHHGPPRVPS